MKQISKFFEPLYFCLISLLCPINVFRDSLREKCPDTEFYIWSVFPCIQSEYRKIRIRKKLRIWTLFTQWLLYLWSFNFLVHLLTERLEPFSEKILHKNFIIILILSMPLQFQENIWTTAPSFPVAFQPLNEFWLFEFWLTHSLITYCTCVYCTKMKEIKWKIILDCVKTRFLKLWKLIAPWLRA